MSFASCMYEIRKNTDWSKSAMNVPAKAQVKGSDILSLIPPLPFSSQLELQQVPLL